MKSLNSTLEKINNNRLDGDISNPETGEVDIERINQLANEIENTIKQFERIEKNASIEGIGSLASRLVIGLTDYILKVGNNLRYTVTGLFKNVKRSELQAFLSSKGLATIKLYNANYSSLYKAKVPYFPYNQSPLTVSAYTNDTFKSLDMYSKVISIIEGYFRLAADIRAKDSDSASATINKLNSLNDRPFTKGVEDNLKKLVVTRVPSNYGTLGQWFASMSELKPVVETTLKSAIVFDEAITISKKMETLYSALEELNKSIEYLIDSNFNISKLKGLTQTIRDSGDLIVVFGVMVKEQSHLEHWTVEVLNSGISSNH